MDDLIKRDAAFVWHPFTQHLTASQPIAMVRAKDTLLFDQEGNAYIDANSSWWVNVHGHGHDHIGKAISEQFGKIDHVVFAGTTHPKAVELAERISGLLPEPLVRTFFSDNGSTAVEVALKMAFQFWYNQGTPKTRVLALDGAYHGDTFGAMSVGQRAYFNTPFEHFFFDVDFLPFPDPASENAILESAEQLFREGNFAALIVEPLVQGSAGMRMYTPKFLDRLVALTRSNGVLIIFDEVMTGFGRTGKLFAMDHCNEKPDLVTLSKGLTGGVLPLGLTVTTNHLYEAFLSQDSTKALLHGHSFTANPLSCAAACASLDLFEDKATEDKIARISKWNQSFADVLSKAQGVRNVRSLGTILAFELETNQQDGYFTELRDICYNFLLGKGILLRPLGNTLFINPPYCISEREYEVLKTAILALISHCNARLAV